MSDLSDAERDACDVVQALAGLASLLRRPSADWPGSDLRDPDGEDARLLLLGIVEDGGAAAARVLAYLREVRGAGDGAAVAVAPRLGLWRDWMPPRGHLFGTPGGRRRADELPQPRRSEPGE